jgi:hypothetical protein
MTPNEAREISENKNTSDAYTLQTDIQDKSQELYETSLSIIEGVAKRGKFETLICYDYEPFNYENMAHSEKIVLIAMRKLKFDGYICSYWNNQMINTMGINVNWRK